MGIVLKKQSNTKRINVTEGWWFCLRCRYKLILANYLRHSSVLTHFNLSFVQVESIICFILCISNTLSTFPLSLYYLTYFLTPLLLFSFAMLHLPLNALLPPAVIHCENRSEPRLVCGRGQHQPLWWQPVERKCLAGSFPIRCGNWQWVHILLPQLWNHTTGKNHTGGWTKSLSRHRDKIETTITERVRNSARWAKAT